MGKLGKVITATAEAEKNKTAYINRRKAEICGKSGCRTCNAKAAKDAVDAAVGKKGSV